MAKEVTMKDIAKKLGVSTVTVSKALTDKEGVSQDLRKEIKRLAQELGYQYGKSLSQSKGSLNIGVIVEEHYIGNVEKELPFYMKMYQSIIVSLAKFHYFAIMEMITNSMMENKIMPNIITDQKVDGIIVLGQMNSKYLAKVRESKIPVVYLDFYDRTMEVPSVITDNVYGSYMITNYLFSMGHRKIAYVGSIDATASILDRYLGYYRSMIMNKEEIRKDYIIADRGEDGLLKELILPAKDDFPTAFVCNCDKSAYWLIEKLQRMGLRVPQDISVVGFDNYSASTVSPLKLTTIEVNIEEMTKNAVEILLRMIGGEEGIHGRKVISGTLLVRESVKKISQ